MLVASGCAASSATPAARPATSPSAASAPQPSQAAQIDPEAVLSAAEAALEADEPARAVALFGRFLSSQTKTEGNPEQLEQAYLGLAHAHEMLRDCAAALLAYDAYLQRFADAEHRVVIWARQGACHAEQGQWEQSAASFRRIRDEPEQLPSVYVEALARQGYALFELGRLERADALLAEADEIFERARAEQTERFSSYYFVGMARFYRAAILHLRFRDVQIELPEKVMRERFETKMDLLVKAQDAYNHTIEAKHMFWVSASGYQLGHLFGEFYDAMMYAPVPKWLDERQKRVYYDELEKQLEPVVKKAVWVFEKNLETARRFGYENQFTELTQAKLAHLQKVMLSDQESLGRPNPRLVPETIEEVAAPEPEARAQRSAADRKLFIPESTPL